MKTNNDNYFISLYKGTTFLRLFLCLSIGVLLYGSVGVPSLWFCIAGAVAFVMLVVSAFCTLRMSQGCAWQRVSATLFAVALPLFLVSFGGVWATHSLPVADGARSAYHQYEVQILSPQKYKNNHLTCDAHITSVETNGNHSSSLIRLNTDTSLILRVGESFTAPLRVYMPRYKGGRFNYPLYLWGNGYAGVAWMHDNQRMSHKDARRVNNPWIKSLREKCVERYSQMGIRDDNRDILSAITLGIRQMKDETQADFRDAGVSHVLVVSGMHVGFLFLLIMFTYKRFKQWWVIVAGAALLWFYALFVGMTSSVVRATLMLSLMLVMKLCGGSYSSLSALALSAIILLIAEPYVLYNVGFQLSFLAVLSIIIFYPAIPDLKFRKADAIPVILKPIRGSAEALYDVARLSLSAQMLVTPLTIYYFGRFPVYFLLANVAIAMLTPVIFIGGLLTLIPLVGYVTAPLVNWIITIYYSVVHWVASLPGATLEISIGFTTMLAVILVLLTLGNVLRSRFSFRSVAVFLVSIPLGCLLSLI